MNNPSTKSYIHYDPERVDYSLNKDELENIRHASQNNWKEFSIACLAVGVPCVINAISEIFRQETFKVTLSFNLNLVVGIIGIVLGIAFLRAWQKTKKNLDEIIKTIKDKPKFEFTADTTNIGEMEEKE